MRNIKGNRKRTFLSLFCAAILLGFFLVFFLGPKQSAQTTNEKRYKPELIIQTGHFDSVNSVVFSPNGKILASASSDNTIKLWNIEAGRQIKSLEGHSDVIDIVVFSQDGRTLASGSIDKTIKLWSIETGQEIKSLANHSEPVDLIAFLPDGKTLVSGSRNDKINLWNIETGQQIKSLESHANSNDLIAFSPDGKTFVGSGDNKINLWSIETGQQIKYLEGHSGSVYSVTFSPDGKILASGGWDKTIKLWNVETGQVVKSLDGHTDSVWSVAFSPDGRTLASGSLDATMKLWEKENGKPLATLTSIDKGDWVVVSPDSRFDASAGALKLMHFVVFVPGSGYEIITLDQLKSKSFTPGLLRDIYLKQKAAGEGEFSITLYPTAEIRQAKPGSSAININLKNRGGGIGRVEVYANGTQIIADAREGKAVDPKSSVVNLPVEIPKQYLNAGANKIEVVAWNTEGDVRSRASEFGLTLEADGTVKGSVSVRTAEEKKTYTGHIYAIVAGISEYAGDFDLRFAAKDAEDMAQALALGGRRLLCGKELESQPPKPCERVHVRLLSTEAATDFPVEGVDFKRFEPKKQNFREVFAEVAAKAKPEDVVVIYFSGHGTAIKSEEARQESAFPDLYLYPTMDAATMDGVLLGNKTLREPTTLSSLEIADWVREIKAEKKAMIFDTCAAGAAQVDLAKLTTKSDDALQIRALDRLRERTGFYVLMGSAADAVSYEANSYRQGLLTFSLLEAMTGARLEDGKFVDVEDWFKYAENKVVDLAKGVGGIQKPRYFKSNYNTQSFYVARIEKPEMNRIPLARPVPMILQPAFLDKTRGYDALELSDKLILKLSELNITAKSGELSAVNYVPARAAKGGVMPSGFYTVEGENVRVELVLRRDEKEIARLEVAGTQNDITEKLLEAIIGAAKLD